MTRSVHSCLAFSVGYTGIGTACLHNLNRIIVLRLPETNLLATRGHPRAALSMRSYTR